jgi:hypothetical protein
MRKRIAELVTESALTRASSGRIISPMGQLTSSLLRVAVVGGCIVGLGANLACAGSDSHPNTSMGAGGSSAGTSMTGESGSSASAGKPSGTAGKPSGGSDAAGGGSDAAGGSPDDGGTSSTGGSPPINHTVGKCDGLGAIDEFENITPPGLDGSEFGVVSVFLDPANSGTVYCGTDAKGVFKSTDCGSTWKKLNTGTNGDLLDTGILWVMAIDHQDPKNIYAGALYGTDLGLFKSTNGGVDWASLFTPGSTVGNASSFFQAISIDPTNHNHLVVSFHDDCTSSFGTGCMAQSQDGGNKWTLFKGPLEGWQEGAGPYVLGATTWLLSTPQDGLYYTDDSGASWKQVGPGTNLSFYKAANGNIYTASDFGIYRSTDYRNWKEIAESPPGNGLVGDGKRIFMGKRVSDDDQPYWVATEADGTDWKPYRSPKMPNGGHYLRYDPDHNLMYSANAESGLWRIVTK